MSTTLINRIKLIVNEPLFERILNDCGYTLFDFQIEYIQRASFKELPEHFQIIILLVECILHVERVKI